MNNLVSKILILEFLPYKLLGHYQKGMCSDLSKPGLHSSSLHPSII